MKGEGVGRTSMHDDRIHPHPALRAGLSLPGRGRRAAPGEGRSCRRATSEGPRRLSSRPAPGSGDSIAVDRRGTVVHTSRMCPNAATVRAPYPTGDPPGRPYIALRQGSGSFEPRAFPSRVGARRWRTPETIAHTRVSVTTFASRTSRDVVGAVREPPLRQNERVVRSVAGRGVRRYARFRTRTYRPVACRVAASRTVNATPKHRAG